MDRRVTCHQSGRDSLLWRPSCLRLLQTDIAANIRNTLNIIFDRLQQTSSIRIPETLLCRRCCTDSSIWIRHGVRTIMKHVLISLAAVLLLPFGQIFAGELRLAAVFSDHMVLQRDKPVPVWGWADPGEKITVEFGGQIQCTVADADGKWQVKLDPMEASAESQTLIVRSEKPDRKADVSDVLVGEVWLGSGQSNMAMTVNRAKDFETEQAAAKFPLIRMFKEESTASATAQAESKGKWAVCSPETVAGYSATLYFFGRELHRELNVPVGLINSSVGGTPIESWIAEDSQAKVPELKSLVDAQAKAAAAIDEATMKANHEKQLARWKAQAEKAKKDGTKAPRRPTDPLEAIRRKGNSGGLFNGKISPLIPYAVRGIIWYQGEANSAPGKGPYYQYQLPLLVNDWRARWGEELPFAWVQLPNFGREGEGWSLVREAMLKTLSLPKTGMAITVDIGETKDIHPKNKQDVGGRLALWALGEVYGKKVPATSGPLPAGHEVNGDSITVTFLHADGGLVAKGGEVKGFVIAGEDQQWKLAQARIVGKTVEVSSSEVSKPVAVRYAWSADPDCNLFNEAGLPASPFRTDEWLVEQPAK
jgi:sialate O-acetylesterase